MVFRESDVALVCYDIERGQKNEDVNDEVEERRLEVRGWIDEVWSTLDIPVLICGCAADMVDTKVNLDLFLSVAVLLIWWILR